jgi:glycosyltransferase involved in cell wall biosynthesis
MNKKRKILMLSDHALSTSGVGCQSRFLANGLVGKGCWSIRQFGAAIKHTDYSNIVVNEDFIIKPIDGFGNRELLLQAIISEQPDVVLIFTDPRFFVWLWQIADEVRNTCPIAYWHVWDNLPFPSFNRPFYENTDLINCHSFLTYEMLSTEYPDKVNFVPHSLPENLFHPLPEEEVKKNKIKLLGEDNVNAFVLLWVNRNARRKRPADVIVAWSEFLKKIKDTQSFKRKPLLLMHTDPNDSEGPNLIEVSKQFNVTDSVVFSNNRVDFEHMNIIHNVSDACINIAYAEGFGLATLEAMNCGKPIIATKTGGLTRQVVNHIDGSENGIALNVDTRTCVGSQNVPYIFEDYANVEQISDAILKLYFMDDCQLKTLGEKARQYALSEFNHDNMINQWHNTLTDLIDNFQSNKIKTWTLNQIEVNQ